MKNITLRNAVLDDFSTYITFYKNAECQFLYTNCNSYKEFDENSYKLLKEMGIDIELAKEDDNTIRKNFEFSLKRKSVFLIEVDKQVRGYITISKSGKEVKIADMSIEKCVRNSENLSLIVSSLIKNIAKNVEIIWCIVCNEEAQCMFKELGFYKNMCHLEKRISDE